MIQIETAGALNAVAAIADEKWVDVLFVGPNDLSQALGVPGHYDDPRYVAAIEKVGSVAREAGKAAGIMLRTADQIPGLCRARLHRVHDQRPLAPAPVGRPPGAARSRGASEPCATATRTSPPTCFASS